MKIVKWKAENNNSVEAKCQARGHHEMAQIPSKKFIEVSGGIQGKLTRF